MTCCSWLSTEPGVKHLLRYNLRSLHNVEPEGRAKEQVWCGGEGAQRDTQKEISSGCISSLMIYVWLHPLTKRGTDETEIYSNHKSLLLPSLI